MVELLLRKGAQLKTTTEVSTCACSALPSTQQLLQLDPDLAVQGPYKGTSLVGAVAAVGKAVVTWDAEPIIKIGNGIGKPWNYKIQTQAASWVST